ncbi:unnamed protein product [Dovyalis caffra]|uniref:Uncharacterized protein n=1 Tax=Dovyalis caffra TaxID=77055 RepID=A0AAV1R1Y6_9ROSI|nr:unnamed protein product [Dovyalis caffra]
MYANIFIVEEEEEGLEKYAKILRTTLEPMWSQLWKIMEAYGGLFYGQGPSKMTREEAIGDQMMLDNNDPIKLVKLLRLHTKQTLMGGIFRVNEGNENGKEINVVNREPLYERGEKESRVDLEECMEGDLATDKEGVIKVKVKRRWTEKEGGGELT